jgi:hypothetical protein
MITKTSIAVIAAVLFGSASFALANDQFDVTIYRPAIQDNALGAYAQSPSLNRGGSGGTGPSKLFSAEERAMFDRTQGPAE